MTIQRFSRLPRLLALAWGLAPCIASAATVTVEPGSDMVVDILQHVSDRYVDGMARAVLSRNTRVGLDSPPKVFRYTREHLKKAVLSQFDYTYTDRFGVPRTHTVYSASGRPHSEILRGASEPDNLASASSGGTTSATTSAGSGSESGMSQGGGYWKTPEEDVAIDSGDSQYFVDDTTGFKRAPKRLDDGDSLLRAQQTTSTRAPGSAATGSAEPRLVDRGADAEFKALRQLEVDIQKHIVEPGGRLVGYVSQVPCESCSTAIDDFAQAYTSETNVFYLARSTSESEGAAAESVKAHKRLVSYRRSALDRLRPGEITLPPGRRASAFLPAKGVIEEELAGNRGETPASCMAVGGVE